LEGEVVSTPPVKKSSGRKTESLLGHSREHGVVESVLNMEIVLSGGDHSLMLLFT
jgi:hypothetical protein